MPMTASNIGGSRGEPLRSASAIVASTESGQHLLKIDGYSGTKDVPTGSHIQSRSFRVGGHSWHICYYPNGLNSTWSDYISIYLQLDYNVPEGVRAQYTFSLLDHGGKPVPRYTLGSEQTFRDLGWGYATFIKRDELEKSEHLKDDRFAIRCDFTVVTSKEIQTMDVDIDTGAIPQPPVVVVPPSDLHRHLGGLLVTGEGADVTFEVDTRTFAAHRCVLMARSPVFHAELSLSSLTTTNDGAAVAVQIEDMEAQDFEAFLHYIYTDSLPEMKGSEAAAMMLPDLVAAANRYKMERLRLVCEDKLSGFVNVTTVAVILAFAVEHHCLGLKEVCLKFLEDPANLREVIKTDGLEFLSKSCPSVLKDMITKLAAAQ
ncbi:BTB/POZ and MATH domain-containing protein 1-like [Miscanthus floridulus]|uniref:BTB/POZ and MATH domain-containing protein 1-like n=1 Tax=Miscanthus floridulus TaxID=154761 RepID=UPI00345AB9EA